MSNAFALRPENLSPTILLQNALEYADDMKAAYIVLVPKNVDQELEIFTTGTTADMTLAVQTLTVICHRYIRGEVVEE